MKANKEYVAAIVALTKIVDGKRLRSVEDSSYLADTPLVQEINERAKKEIGVDVFSIKNNHEIELYVNYLNDAVRMNISRNTNSDELNDEVALIKIAKPFPVDGFKGFNIRHPKDFIVEPIIQSLRLNKLDVNQIIRNPDFAQIASLELSIYFLSARVKIRSKDSIMLVVLHKEPMQLDVVTISSIYVFKENEPRINSPVRMFVKALDKYGVPMTLGVKTQKFFYEGFMTSYDREAISRVAKLRGLKSMIFKGALIQKSLGFEYEFAYSDNVKKIAEDLSSMQFI